MTIWRMRIACLIPKATKTYSCYVILIAFPLQLWLHEHASLLRYTYIAAIVWYDDMQDLLVGLLTLGVVCFSCNCHGFGCCILCL
jgi:hypothetical protein